MQASALRYQDRVVQLLEALERQGVAAPPGGDAGAELAEVRRHAREVKPPPPPAPSYYVDTPRPSPRTNRTRRVPHPVLIGHAASLSQVKGAMQERIARLASLLMHERAARRDAQEAHARAAGQLEALFRAGGGGGDGGAGARDAYVAELHGEVAGLRDTIMLLTADNAELAHERERLRRRAAEHAEAAAEELRGREQALAPPPLVLSGHAASLTPY